MWSIKPYLKHFLRRSRSWGCWSPGYEGRHSYQLFLVLPRIGICDIYMQGMTKLLTENQCIQHSVA
jgi:hypothetical protein